ncbi:hypothetical protein D3C81_1086510 [compost metagenome]
MRREHEAVAQLQQRGFVFIGQPAEKVHIFQTQFGCLLLKLPFKEAPAHDRHWQAIEFCGLQQIVQALVVAQRADEQEKPLTQPRAPVRQLLRGCLGVGRPVQAIGDDRNLVFEARQHRAMRGIVGR